MTGPQLIVLNPYSQYGKEFTPAEVKQLIEGTISKAIPPTTIGKDTKVFLGQPKKYPQELVNSLKTLFSERGDVKAAYLAHVADPSSNEPPHNIIGILPIDTANFAEIIKQAGLVVNNVLKKTDFVDFMRIESNSEVSDYMVKETVPFYTKK
jgi:hypothetical protein